MKTLAITFAAGLSLAGAALLLDACGGNSAATLQSISVNYAALPEPTGTAQFIATGHYNDPSSIQTPLAVEAPLQQGWSYSRSQGSGAISLTQDGLAKCGTAKGTFVVAAWADKIGAPECNVVGPGDAPCGSIAATAELTCP